MLSPWETSNLQEVLILAQGVMSAQAPVVQATTGTYNSNSEVISNTKKF